MHKTHIFDQKNNPPKNCFYRSTYPILFQTVTGNKQFLFLGLKHIVPSIFRCAISESGLEGSRLAYSVLLRAVVYTGAIYSSHVNDKGACNLSCHSALMAWLRPFSWKTCMHMKCRYFCDELDDAAVLFRTQCWFFLYWATGISP